MLIAPRSFAWGPEGHRVVGDVARAHLTPVARQQVRTLLGDDDLANVANWADEIKADRPETAGWHFVDIPTNASGFSETRDCSHPSEKSVSAQPDRHNCVVDRIDIFQQVLADPNAARVDRIEALKFLVHFVGDVHQPLHAIAEARGGNEIQVIEFGSSRCGSRACNLHFAWDTGLIEHSQRREADYDKALEELISREKLSARADSTPGDWANESFKTARQAWVKDGGAIDQVYYRKNISVVDEKLALAGLRLARLLNQALGTK